MAAVQIKPSKNQRYFCAQFVIQAFRSAGKPLTDFEPERVSPADILHMRAEDVSTIPAQVRLQYVGHLRCTPSPWNRSCAVAAALAGPSS